MLEEISPEFLAVKSVGLFEDVLAVVGFGLRVSGDWVLIESVGPGACALLVEDARPLEGTSHEVFAEVTEGVPVKNFGFVEDFDLEVPLANHFGDGIADDFCVDGEVVRVHFLDIEDEVLAEGEILGLLEVFLDGLKLSDSLLVVDLDKVIDFLLGGLIELDWDDDVYDVLVVVEVFEVEFFVWGLGFAVFSLKWEDELALRPEVRLGVFGEVFESFDEELLENFFEEPVILEVLVVSAVAVEGFDDGDEEALEFDLFLDFADLLLRFWGELGEVFGGGVGSLEVSREVDAFSLLDEWEHHFIFVLGVFGEFDFIVEDHQIVFEEQVELVDYSHSDWVNVQFEFCVG